MEFIAAGLMLLGLLLLLIGVIRIFFYILFEGLIWVIAFFFAPWAIIAIYTMVHWKKCSPWHYTMGVGMLLTIGTSLLVVRGELPIGFTPFGCMLGMVGSFLLLNAQVKVLNHASEKTQEDTWFVFCYAGFGVFSALYAMTRPKELGNYLAAAVVGFGLVAMSFGPPLYRAVDHVMKQETAKATAKQGAALEDLYFQLEQERASLQKNDAAAIAAYKEHIADYTRQKDVFTKKKNQKGGIGEFGMMAGIACLIIFLGFHLVAGGGLGLILTAFRTSDLWGFLSLLPPLSLLYAVVHRKGGKMLGYCMAGLVMVVGGVVMIMSTISANANVEQQVSEKPADPKPTAAVVTAAAAAQTPLQAAAPVSEQAKVQQMYQALLVEHAALNKNDPKAVAEYSKHVKEYSEARARLEPVKPAVDVPQGPVAKAPAEITKPKNTSKNSGNAASKPGKPGNKKAKPGGSGNTRSLLQMW